MRKFWLHIALSCLCLTCLAGCGNSGYDRRLVAADSLMAVSPDSARAVLRAIDADRLSRADRAYHALLSTQAAYKCFDSIPSTATIDRAVDYFSSGSDREKLTRSLIYKGAVLSELNRKTEAMELYKQAEESAASTDYANLGYANFRMAELYQWSFAESELDIDKYKKAYYYYKCLNDTANQIKCLNYIGPIYRASNIDSAYNYILKAISLAKEFGDKESEITNFAYLARAYEVDSAYDKERNVALYAFKEGSTYLKENGYYNNCCYDLCKAYLKLGCTDSAYYYFEHASAPNTPHECITRLLLQADFAEAKGDYKKALDFWKNAENTVHYIETNSERQQLFYSEREYDRHREELKALKNQRDKAILFGVIIITLLVMVVVAITLYLRYKNTLRYLDEQLSQLRIDSVIQLERHLNKEAMLTESIASYINKAKQLTELYHYFGNHPQKLHDKFLNLLEDSNGKTQFWGVLRSYVDAAFDNATEKIISKYPDLTDSEITVICMLLCDFSNVLISVYMGYKSPHYVYNKKKMIATKMGINDTLDNFILKLRTKQA